MLDQRSRTMETPKTILILGGGVGGVVTAIELRKKLGRQHRIILIDREQAHVFAPSLLWLMVGLRKPGAIQRPLGGLKRKGMLRRYSAQVDVRHGEIEKIDPTRLAVTVAGEEIIADYIVVALGAELAPETIPGLNKSGFNFYTLPGAEALHAALGQLKSGRVVVLTAAPAYKCPAAPYEAALLIDAYFSRQKLRDSVKIDVYAAEVGPMGVAGPEMSGAVKQLLANKNIPYHPDHQITSVDVNAKKLVFANGAEADFDVLAYVPPHRPPRVIGDSGLAGDTGWVAVDRHTLETRFAGVYAIGDVVSIPLKLGRPLPKAGVFAHAQAKVVAANIVAAIKNRADKKQFSGHGECFIEIGDGKAGFGGGDFYAEPKPVITIHPPSRRWHIAKVLFEKLWLFTKF